MHDKKLVISAHITASLLGALILSDRSLSAGTISLSVSAGVTNELAQVLPAPYVDTDGGASLGANDIEVSGPGVLTFSQPLASWTGNLTVKAGGIVRAVIGETSVLGNAGTGAVYVEDGATLRSDDSAGAGNGKAIARAIHIAGKGAPGEYCALRIYCLGDPNASLRSSMPDKIVLTADASIAFGSMMREVVNEWKTIDLQSHTLTFTADGDPNPQASNMPRFYYSGTYVKNPGRIVHDHTVLEARRIENFEGTSANTLVLTNGALLTINNAYGNGWTLLVDPSANSKLIVEPNYRAGWTTTAVYDGPVVLGRSLAFDENDRAFTGSYAATSNSFGFAGVVSGPGGLSISSPRARNLNYFHLNAAANSFAGGLAATNFTMLVKSPTAVPAGAQAGMLRLKDSDVRLAYALSNAADFAFPHTLFDGSGVIGATNGFANGSFDSLTKTGTGELTLKTTGGIGQLSLVGGRVTFAGRHSVAGVQVGTGPKVSNYYNNPFKDTGVNTKFVSDRSVKDFTTSVLYTNAVTATFPAIFYTPHGADTVRPGTDDADFDYWNGWANPRTNGWYASFQGRIMTGAGYLWNGSSEPKTIRVVCTLNAYCVFKFGDTTINQPVSGDIYRNHPGTVKNRSAEQSAWNYEPSTPKNPHSNFTVTLQPGATRVEVRVWDRYGDIDGNGRLCYGNICTNGLANWRDDRGLMWTDKLDSNDMNDYHMFADDGNGAFLTAKTTTELSSSIQIGTLAGSGGEIDLDDVPISVNALSGKPVIVGGSVALTGPWTLTAADVMNGTPLEAVDLTGCAQIVMSSEEENRLVRLPNAVTEYVLARNATAAVPVCDALAAKNWKTVLKGDGDLVLQRPPPGVCVIFR